MILPVVGTRALPKRADCPKPVQSTQGRSIELIISGMFERDILLAKDSLIMAFFPLLSSTPNIFRVSEKDCDLRESALKSVNYHVWDKF